MAVPTPSYGVDLADVKVCGVAGSACYAGAVKNEVIRRHMNDIDLSIALIFVRMCCLVESEVED